MIKDLSGAVRTLRRQPAFSLAAAGTLALGIAASTAVFCTVNAALLRPLPYPDAEQIYSLRTAITDGRFTSGMVAAAELLSLKAAAKDVTHAAGAQRLNLAASTATGPVDSVTYAVSDDFMPMFGARMSLGRAFQPEDHVRGAAMSVVLSHKAWLQHFGGEPDVVGKTLRFSVFSAPARIVGVAEPGFDIPASTDFWVNTHLSPDNIGHNNNGYIRLAPGATIESIREPMAAVMQQLGKRFPDQNQDRVFVAMRLREATVGDLRPVLLILFGATGFLLAIAAANLANLMIARGSTRAREMAIRGALGATRAQLIRQMLAESMVLAVAGGALGVAGAIAGVRLLQAVGASALPRLDSVPFDLTVGAFAAITIALTGFLSGLVPALVTGRSDLAPVLNAGGRSAMSGRLTQRLLAGMVVAQVAFTVALVGGAGRLMRSIENLTDQDRGFTSEPRLILDVNLPYGYGDIPRVSRWIDEAGARLRNLGATGVAAASSLPLRPELDTTVHVDLVSDPDIPPRYRPNARLRYITPEFLDVMDIRLIGGRPFSETDRQGSQPVVLINESFARRFLKGRDPLREQVRIPGFWMHRRNDAWVHEAAQVIGLVADTRYTALDKQPEQTVYVTMAQMPSPRFGIVVRAPGRDLDALGHDARNVLQQIDPNVPLETDTMQGAVDASLSRQQLGVMLMSAFGVAAIVLGAVGVFGVIAFAVSQRTGEMAVRLAIGASTRQVFLMVMRQGGAIVILGSLLGVVLSWWTGRLMTAYVYEVRSLDPVVIGGSVAIVGLVATAATAILARRASRVSPSRALHTGT